MEFCKLAIDAGAFFLWAMLLLVLPLKWIAAFVLASMWHEGFHYVAIRLVGAKVNRIRIGMCGIQMEVSNLTLGQECFCALAGPAGGFLLLLTVRWYPELSLCALVQSAYNLLPIYPLDGGRALKCLCQIYFGAYAYAICQIAEYMTLLCILAIGFSLNWGVLSLMVGICLFGKILHGKIPCKPHNLRVQ